MRVTTGLRGAPAHGTVGQVDPTAIALARVVADALGVPVTTMVPVAGGDVAASYRAVLGDGRVVFAKTHRAPPPGAFTTEAEDLRWLGASGAALVPQVLAAGEAGADDHDVAHLVLEWIEVGRARAGTEAELGRSLAALHRSGAPAFGRLDRRTTGSRRLPNEPASTWAEHYAENRLRPLARLAADADALPARSLDDLEAIAGHLDELAGPAEPPARLHGDLWAGNRIVDRDGRSWLIDPAAHGGHREHDLAMMRLFGGFGDACFDAYEEVHPLAAGWAARVPLHQLAPLVVHAIKFGGGYVGATERALDVVLGR